MLRPTGLDILHRRKEPGPEPTGAARVPISRQRTRPGRAWKSISQRIGTRGRLLASQILDLPGRLTGISLGSLARLTLCRMARRQERRTGIPLP